MTTARTLVEPLLNAAGIEARTIEYVLARLDAGWTQRAELMHTTGITRRDLDVILRQLSPLLEMKETSLRMRSGASAGLEPPIGPIEAPSHLIHELDDLRQAAPPPLQSFDQVQATTETLARRATWMRQTFSLRNANILFLGDHDLTCLSLCLSDRSIKATVVDVDDRVLEYIATIAEARQLSIDCIHSDLRFTFPLNLVRWADIVFTDPPYTPEGISLFANRGLLALRTDRPVRLLIAYGYSHRHPSLGHSVQQQLIRNGVVFQYILPRFNHYNGAEAIGSAADLYVCQPASSKRPKRKSPITANMYTHGQQALEAPQASPSLIKVLRSNLGLDDIPVSPTGWDAPADDARPITLFDLSRDIGPWILRTLLAQSANTLVMLLPNDHPNLRSQHGQQLLQDLLTAKYKLEFQRSRPDSKHAIVVANRVPISNLSKGQMMARHILDRAHGRIRNVWRDALCVHKDISAEAAAATIDRSQFDGASLDLRLIDLPRFRIANLLTEVESSWHCGGACH